MGRFGAIYKDKNNFPDSFGKDHGLQLEPSVNFVLFTWYTYQTSGLEHPIFYKSRLSQSVYGTATHYNIMNISTVKLW